MDFLNSLLLNLSILLMCFLPGALLGWLMWSNWKRQQNQLSFLAGLLEKAGFQPISPFKALLKRDNILYQTPSGNFSLSLIPQYYGEGGRLIDLVCFRVHLPHSSKFLICSPSLSQYTGSILYETYWKSTTLNTLSPLGLQVICDHSNAERIRRRLEQPVFQQIFLPLVHSRETFYILSDSDVFFSIAFALQPSSTQRGAMWLLFVRQFSQAWTSRA